MKTKFKLGEEVWRVQVAGRSWIVVGPATVTALVVRQDSVRYLLTWPPHGDGKYIEVTDEQDGARLYRSRASAKRAADRQHNDALRRQMRGTG